jgi:hypothetical protein
MSSQSVVGVALRAIAFPISLQFLAPMLSVELFDAVMQDISMPLYERLRDAPVVPLRVWLPVHLARTLPLLAAGLVLWVCSKYRSLVLSSRQSVTLHCSGRCLRRGASRSGSPLALRALALLVCL